MRGTLFGFALDDPAPGFTLANPQHMKPATAALLDGAALALKASALVAMVAAVCLGPDELVAEARFDALAALAVNAISRGIASHSVVGRSEVMPATDANQAPVFVLTISFNTECEAP